MTTVQDLMETFWGDDSKISRYDPRVNLENRFMQEVNRVKGILVKEMGQFNISKDLIEVSMVSFIVKVILGKAYVNHKVKCFKDLDKATRDMIKIIGKNFFFTIDDEDEANSLISMRSFKDAKKIPIPTFMESEICFTPFNNSIIMKVELWETNTPYFNDELEKKLTSNMNSKNLLNLCTICDLEVRKNIQAVNKLPYWDLIEYICSKHRKYMDKFQSLAFDPLKMKMERAEVSSELVKKTKNIFGLEMLRSLVMSDLFMEVMENMEEDEYYLLELLCMELAHFRRMFCMNPNLVELSKKVFDMPLMSWHHWMKEATEFWLRTCYFSKEKAFDLTTAYDMAMRMNFEWDQSNVLYEEQINSLFYEFKRRVTHRIKTTCCMKDVKSFEIDSKYNMAEMYFENITSEKVQDSDKMDTEEMNEALKWFSEFPMELDYESVMESNGMLALVYSRNL